MMFTYTTVLVSGLPSLFAVTSIQIVLFRRTVGSFYKIVVSPVHNFQLSILSYHDLHLSQAGTGPNIAVAIVVVAGFVHLMKY